MSLQHIQKNSPRLLPKPAKFEKNPPNGYRVIRKTKCGAGGAGGAGSSPIHKQAGRLNISFSNAYVNYFLYILNSFLCLNFHKICINIKLVHYIFLQWNMLNISCFIRKFRLRPLLVQNNKSIWLKLKTNFFVCILKNIIQI